MKIAGVGRTFQQNRVIGSSALLITLAVLLILSPAEATLGNVVKIVYLHGAAERIAMYAFLASAGLAVVQLVRPRQALHRWTRAALETAIVFWALQFLVSLPAQVLAWGSLVWNEPRVVGATWILGLSVFVYAVALWLREASWMALAACAAAAMALIVLRGAINVLHPLSPIIGSDSMSIKLFYGAIVIAVGGLAFEFAHLRAAQLK